jgi:hypothetical protein
MNATLRETQNFNVINFNDLQFKPHPMGFGKQAVIQFSNGYGASVVQGPYTYGADAGLYELAVFGKDGYITYDTPITDDVVGSITEDEVSEILEKIQNL